jgi:hypothetical protein
MTNETTSIERYLDLPGTQLNFALSRPPRDGMTFSEEAIHRVVEQMLLWIVSRIGRAAADGQPTLSTRVRVVLEEAGGRDDATWTFDWKADQDSPLSRRRQYSGPAMIDLMGQLGHWITSQIAELVILDARFPSELTIRVDAWPGTGYHGL